MYNKKNDQNQNIQKNGLIFWLLFLRLFFLLIRGPRICYLSGTQQWPLSWNIFLGKKKNLFTIIRGQEFLLGPNVNCDMGLALSLLWKNKTMLQHYCFYPNYCYSKQDFNMCRYSNQIIVMNCLTFKCST